MVFGISLEKERKTVDLILKWFYEMKEKYLFSYQETPGI